MTRRMGAREARANFGDLLGEVYYGGEPVIVEKKGRPFAVVISPAEYERYQKLEKERLFELIHAVQERNLGKDPDELEADIAAAIDEVRRGADAEQTTTSRN